MHVRRYLQALGSMPARPFQDHQNTLVGVSLRHLGQEHAHRFGIGSGQYQRIVRAVARAQGRKGILVLAHDLGVDFRAPARRSPAPARVADAPEAGLVLQHHAYWQIGRLGGYLFLNQVGQLFLKVSRASSLAFGCLGRGIILRHPWRGSARYTTEWWTARPTAAS